jgi:hypothetical protein
LATSTSIGKEADMKLWRMICTLGTIVIALTIVGSGSAFAGNTPTSPLAQAQWQGEIANVPTPGHGCYHASYPALQWQATACLVAPNIPFAPRLATQGGPAIVGDGSDYAAKVTGTTSKATGTFARVTTGITEKGKVDNTGANLANAFSLQLNSQFFSGTPACSGAAVPSNCAGWQQFVYAFHASGNTNAVFMQYWLLFYDTTCPAGWNAFTSGGHTDCYTNSLGTAYGSLPASALGQTTFAGQAVSGGNDTVSLSSPSGASSVSNGDSMLDLSAFWNATEWGVFGDAGGAQAKFGTNSRLEPVTMLHGTSSSAPTCVAEGFTGETNNLSFTKTKALGSESSPTMAITETNGKLKKPSCQVAS